MCMGFSDTRIYRYRCHACNTVLNKCVHAVNLSVAHFTTCSTTIVPRVHDYVGGREGGREVGSEYKGWT